MRVDQFVFAVRTKVVPLLVCLRSSCCHVTGVGGPLRFVRLALKNGMQNDGDFVDVIPLYTEIFLCIPGYKISGDSVGRRLA